MPQADFGQKTPLDKRGNYIELERLNESITFRLIKGAVYDGKHFQQHDDLSWTVTPCPRIMEENPCDICDKYFDLAKQAKQLIKQGKDKKSPEVVKLRKQAQAFQPKITFYYPIIDRQDGEAKILKTTMGVRIELDKKHNDGVKVLEKDWTLTRTQVEGQYYKLEEAKTQTPLSTAEEAALMFASDWDVEEMIDAKSSSQTYEGEPS